jgi:hypothetical protein
VGYLGRRTEGRAGLPLRLADSPSGRRQYRRRKLEIRESPGLSWEKKERAIKALSDRHYENFRELETLERAESPGPIEDSSAAWDNGKRMFDATTRTRQAPPFWTGPHQQK